MSERTEAEVITELAMKGLSEFKVENTPLRLVPDNTRVESLECYLENPTEKRGRIILEDMDSLAEYVKAHKSQSTVGYASPDNGRVIVVLDDHESGENGTPGWARHRASYIPKKGLEWAEWNHKSGDRFSQREFAEFLEDNLPDIAKPNGAELLGACSTLSTKKEMTFDHAIRLNDGTVDFEYREKVTDGEKKGAVNLPSMFTLGLAPFQGGKKYKVEARLRWKIGNEDGKLRFHYLLNRPYEVWDEAFLDLAEDLKAKAGIPVLIGGPRDRKDG